MSSTEYTVVGMTCGHCVTSVKEEVGAVPGVTGVEVDLTDGRLTVTADGALDDSRIREAVQEAGYQVKG
ncbi:heavy-metal-associated domain-containing protein [Thermomonospora umbrina]|uniref:Copper ion binding protein n=1 Tax=Thermomonospora umbrina TaxID=111806 RepID=A0A3D9SWM0_9ACTN|nr:heavy metal-associated domain-containing protein [Thermomonospora umbrina]REE97395.1 copper ion binding protein [Thermomonospora umbrina]